MLIQTTSSNIVESNMLHSFGHHVARCCVKLDDIERSLISIKHRLQHHPIFLLFLSVNKTVAFVWPPCSTLLNTRMPTKLTFHGNDSLFILAPCAFRVDVKIWYDELGKFSITLRRKCKRSLRK